jgi:hypothetical protein
MISKSLYGHHQYLSMTSYMEVPAYSGRLLLSTSVHRLTSGIGSKKKKHTLCLVSQFAAFRMQSLIANSPLLESSFIAMFTSELQSLDDHSMLFFMFTLRSPFCYCTSSSLFFALVGGALLGCLWIYLTHVFIHCDKECTVNTHVRKFGRNYH